MMFQSWLDQSIKRLSNADITTARLDSFVLLEDATKKDRSWLLAHPEFELAQSLTQKLDKQIERRSKHEPLSYIRGKKEFYGLDFIVDKHTLEPRPETETMLYLFNDLINSSPMTTKTLKVIDVGCGSGAIAISVKKQYSDIKVIATDIDINCIKVSIKNADVHNVSIDFYLGNLLDGLQRLSSGAISTIILANLPYVPTDYRLNKAAMHEPSKAIFGGINGLNYYELMFKQIAKINRKPIYVMTESLFFQHNDLESLGLRSGYYLFRTEDLIQVFKLI